jgi:hypothetical protein
MEQDFLQQRKGIKLTKKNTLFMEVYNYVHKLNYWTVSEITLFYFTPLRFIYIRSSTLYCLS